MATASRKGSIRDSFGILIGTLLVSISAVVSFMLITEVGNASSVLGGQGAFESAKQALGLLDTGIVFIVATFYIASWVLAWQIPTSPIFVVPALLMNGLALWISATFSNIFSDVVNANTLVQSAANNFPALATFMEGLPIYIGVFNTVLLVVIFVTPRSQGRPVV